MRKLVFIGYRILAVVVLFSSPLLAKPLEMRITERDSAITRFDYVFKGTIIGDSSFRDTDYFPNLMPYPYYMVTQRIAFDIDTLYKGIHVDTFTLEYRYSADTCEEKPMRFRMGDVFELGVNRMSHRAPVSYITFKANRVEKPYTVKGTVYVRIRESSYVRYLGPRPR